MDGATILAIFKEALKLTISYLILILKVVFGAFILILGILLLLYTTTGEFVFGGHMSAAYVDNTLMDLMELLLSCVPFSNYLFSLLNIKSAVSSFQGINILSELAKTLMMFLSATASIEIAKFSYSMMKKEVERCYIWMQWLGNFLFNCLILPTIVVFSTFFHEIFTRAWSGLFGSHSSSSIAMIIFIGLVLLFIGWLLNKRARESFIHLLTSSLIIFTMCLCVIVGFCYLSVFIYDFSYYRFNTAELWGVLIPFLVSVIGFSILMYLKKRDHS